MEFNDLRIISKLSRIEKQRNNLLVAIIAVSLISVVYVIYNIKQNKNKECQN